MARMSGRQAIMEIFRAEGVQYIFGNPGTTELGFVCTKAWPWVQRICTPMPRAKRAWSICTWLPG
jgi:hypothetical protein